MNGHPSATPQQDMETWRRYSTTHEQLMSHLARELARETGLSEADYQVLDALVDLPDARARSLELRLALQWEKSRLSHQIARMAGRGLLDRQACVEDARGADVVLTPAGRAAALRARHVRAESVERIVFGVLSPELVASLTEATTLLADALARAAREDPACRAAWAEAMERAGDRASRCDNP